MKIAIVGATGLVGRTMLQGLYDRGYASEDITLLASDRSAGQEIQFGEFDPDAKRRMLTVQPLSSFDPTTVQVALFSAGGNVSREFAPLFAKAGCVVIDNSSAFRMDPDVPLVVPEVNAADIAQHNGIIANPNCSTIQLVVALMPLSEKFGLNRVVVSTYQSVSGAGQKGVQQMNDEVAGREPTARITPHTVAFNTVFHSFMNNESTEEELKVVNETRRIMHLPDLRIAVTCVRVPVLGGHAESVNVETTQPATADNVREVLLNSPGIVVMDDPKNDLYPTPKFVNDRDEVFIGRIRKDASVKNGVHLWVVANNLRKGAATNAIQIMEHLQLK